MRLFLDTDVLVDVAVNRQPFADPAAALLDRIQSEHDTRLSGYVSWSSFLEFNQEATPMVGQSATAEFCTELCSFLKVTNARGPHLTAALAFNLPEFRATLQVAAAIACKADVIVTAHGTQFQGLRIPVKPPSALVEDLAGT